MKINFSKLFLSKANAGFSVPFILVLVGLFFLIRVPIDTESFDKFSGVYQKTAMSDRYFKLKNYNFIFEFSPPKDAKNVVDLFNEQSEVAILGVRKDDSIIVKQVYIDGKLVLKYSWFKNTYYLLILILIGIVLIPIVLKEKRKYPKIFEEKTYK